MSTNLQVLLDTIDELLTEDTTEESAVREAAGFVRRQLDEFEALKKRGDAEPTPLLQAPIRSLDDARTTYVLYNSLRAALDVRSHWSDALHDALEFALDHNPDSPIPEWATPSIIVNCTAEYLQALGRTKHTEEKDERLEDAVLELEGVDEVSVNHWCWARVNLGSRTSWVSLPLAAEHVRAEMLRLLKEIYG